MIGAYCVTGGAYRVVGTTALVIGCWITLGVSLGVVGGMYAVVVVVAGMYVVVAVGGLYGAIEKDIPFTAPTDEDKGVVEA